MDGWVTRLIERASRQELFRGESALHEACYSAAPLEAIRRIIFHHPEAILIQDANGRIPLHWALSSKTQYAKARLLLQFLRHQAVHGNGNVNVNDHVNVHVHDTTSLNRHHIHKMLLARNELGYTALDHACSSGAPSDILEALITLCPQAATVKRMGRTPLHQLLDYVQSNELQIETSSMKILLHAHPHAVSDADRLGNIPLHLAVYEQTNVEAFMMLLEHSQSHGERERESEHERERESQSLSLPWSFSLNRNPNPNRKRNRNRNPNIVATKNRLGATPLHIAAMNNAPSHVIDAIIEASPSTVHAMDVDGNVPLHLAFIYRASVLLKSRLIYHGGERLLGVVNDRGQTPIQGTAYVEDVYDILRIMPHVACSCY